MIINFTNVIGSIRSLGEAAQVITTNLKIWLGFETSETLGREEVVNGDYSNGLTGWSTQIPSGQVVEVVNNQLHIDYDSSETQASTGVNQTILDANKTYQIEVDIESVTGRVRIQAGGVVNDISTDGIKTFIVKPTSAILYVIRASNTENLDVVINSISIKELTQITPDKSGNNNVGELFTGKALEFDGSTSYVSANSFATNDTLSNDTAFTFALWFNSSKSTTARFFGNILISSGGTAQATNIFKIGVNPRTTTDIKADNTVINIGGIYFDDSSGYNNVVPSSGGVNYNDGQWHRLVVARRAGSGNQDLSFYVDGSLIDTAPCNPLWSNMSVFDFGQEWDGAGESDFFQGKMSNIQVYNYAWTTDDITYDYANPQNLVTDRSGTSIELSNLKGYWAMSEGAGSIAYDSGTKLGAEQIVDGNFPTGTTAWTKGSDTTIGSNEASFDGTASYVSQNILVVGKIYECSVRVKTWVSGAALAVGSAATGGGTVYKEITRADNTTTTFTFKAVATTLGVGSKSFDVEGSIDLVSVKEVISSNNNGTINGATYEPAQPRIPQLGMMNFSNGAVATGVTLIPNPINTSQDIDGNAVRDRLNSLNLDGSGYAEVAEVLGLDVTDFSLEAWVKFDYTNSGSSTNVIYVNGGVSTSVNTFALATDEDNKVRFIVGGVTLYSTTVFSNNNWVHIAGTRESGALKLYINGNKTPEATGTSNALVNNTLDLLVGRDTNVGDNRFYKERISDVRLYSSALSAKEVRNNYNAGLSAHTND